MPKKSAEFEREQEMSLIWGGGAKSKRAQNATASNRAILAQGAVRIHAHDKAPLHAQPLPDDYEDKARIQKQKQISELISGVGADAADNDDDDDLESVISFISDTADEKKVAANTAARTKAKKDKKAKDPRHRLHCFVEPGTTKNDVRTVFEGYGDPEVELRTSQKGNALNKTHFAVLTFKNKPHALWAALNLDGSNQRDSIGTNPMILNMFLSREEQKSVKRRAAKKAKSEKA